MGGLRKRKEVSGDLDVGGFQLVKAQTNTVTRQCGCTEMRSVCNEMQSSVMKEWNLGSPLQSRGIYQSIDAVGPMIQYVV